MSCHGRCVWHSWALVNEIKRTNLVGFSWACYWVTPAQMIAEESYRVLRNLSEVQYPRILFSVFSNAFIRDHVFLYTSTDHEGIKKHMIPDEMHYWSAPPPAVKVPLNTKLFPWMVLFPLHLFAINKPLLTEVSSQIRPKDRYYRLSDSWSIHRKAKGKKRDILRDCRFLFLLHLLLWFKIHLIFSGEEPWEVWVPCL